MMQRFPVTVRGAPACFSRLDKLSTVCRGCYARRDCKRASVMADDEGVTLAERINRFDDGYRLDPEAEAIATYTRCYQRVFTRNPSERSVAMSGPKIVKVAIDCRKREFDFPTYVMGNMRIIKATVIDRQKPVKGRPTFAFQPSMLSGTNAVNRYYAFIREQQDYTNGVTYEGDRESVYAKTRGELLALEREVGGRVISLTRRGHVPDDEQAAKDCGVLTKWKRHCLPVKPPTLHGLDGVVYARMKVYARLSAAQHLIDALASRNGGVRPSEHLVLPGDVIDWPEFAEFVAAVYPL